MTAEQLVDRWRDRGRTLAVGADPVFVVDVPADGPEAGPPLLVVHGFPTSSIDFEATLGTLRRGRRVVLLDLPGYGLSAKPDRPYSLFGQADVVVAVAAALGLGEVDLLTHDMGDSVGGELLARAGEGALPFSVRRRVLTNGSIYIDMAQLTAGQQWLAALPDEALAPEAAPGVDGLVASLAATMAPGAPVSDHLRAAALLVVHDGGARLLPRLIRYLDERRAHEDRWTGAIESHPAPLTVVWGDADPIAVFGMTDVLLSRRPDADRVRLDAVGHFPMVEAPARFAAAVTDALG